MTAYRRVYDSRHLQADQLRNPMLGNRVWLPFTFLAYTCKRLVADSNFTHTKRLPSAVSRSHNVHATHAVELATSHIVLYCVCFAECIKHAVTTAQTIRMLG